MNTAEINIDCLRAAEQILRDHDALIAAAADDLKRLRRERVPKAERVQACIDVLCGRATPGLFTPPAVAADVPVSEPVVVVSPVAPPPDVTPPLAPGVTVELDAVKAAKVGDIAALQTPDLEPIVDWLLNDTETETVGELWDWIDEDYGGMRHAGITAMMRRRGPKEYLPHADAFATAVMMFIANNGHGAAVEKGEGDDTPAAPEPDPDTATPFDPTLVEDLTAEEEARIGAKPTKSPGDERKLKAMAEWRQRQLDGTATPTWGLWAEFQVYLADGSMVVVLYDPTWGSGVDHFEFNGQAISPTGYRSHFENLKNGRRPKQPLEAWAKAFCEKLAGETKVAKAKAAKQKLKAPPKAPKSKGKVKA